MSPTVPPPVFRRPMRSALLCLSFALAGTWAGPVGAELPSFDAFYTGVTECRLDLTRFGALIDSYGEGAVIALPNASAMRGFLIDSFYVAPRRGPTPAQYGLLINAPLEAVQASFPEFVERATVNGHLRRLTRMSEMSRAGAAGRKTLLVCIEGIAL
jgi:hypothetical protein